MAGFEALDLNLPSCNLKPAISLKVDADFVTSAAGAADLPRDGLRGDRAGRSLERRQVEPDQRAGPAAGRADERGARQDAARERLPGRAGQPRAVLPRRSPGVRIRARRSRRARDGDAGVFRAGRAGRAGRDDTLLPCQPPRVPPVSQRSCSSTRDTRPARATSRRGAGCGRRSSAAAIVATKIDKLARGRADPRDEGTRIRV